MRKLLLLIVIALFLLLGIAVAAGAIGHWAASLNDMRVTVDGETLDGPAIAAIVGVAAFFGIVVACLIAFAVVASVAIVIPLVLIAVAGALAVALFAGLLPLAIPVLLMVGAYVLLSRRSKRKAGANPAPSLPRSTSPEQPIPHA